MSPTTLKKFFAHIFKFSPLLFTVNNCLCTNYKSYLEFRSKHKRLSFSATGFYSPVSCNIDYMPRTLNWNYVRHPFRLAKQHQTHFSVFDKRKVILSCIYTLLRRLPHICECVADNDESFIR